MVVHPTETLNAVDKSILQRKRAELYDMAEEEVPNIILNKKYHLNPHYVPEDAEEEMDVDMWEPEVGADYWDENRFNLDYWNDELNNTMNLLKISDKSGVTLDSEPVYNIQMAIGYHFINENLLRQAFTRRAFAVEYRLMSRLNFDTHAGCCEELELLVIPF